LKKLKNILNVVISLMISIFIISYLGKTEANLDYKVTTVGKIYEDGLNRIFSQPPSHLGYKNDIEALLNELGLKMEELLYLTISSLSKISRNKNEIKIIASYLYLMPDIIKLLKGKRAVNIKRFNKFV